MRRRSVCTEPIQLLRKKLLDFHTKHGRHSLPWRKISDPYAVLVSEMMLQQTQVPRVIPKFEAWMKRFPTVQHLARAPIKDVLTLWSGLGYNRRAKHLHGAAQLIVTKHGGVMPATIPQLEALPGVGAYTARAVIAFSFDISHPFIETNIRTVLIHKLFARSKRPVHDSELMPIISSLIEGVSARTIYMALMDYGTHLKATLGSKRARVHKKSAHYSRQSRFEGSKRQLRAALLKKILASGSITVAQAKTLAAGSAHSPQECLESMAKEGLIHKKRSGAYAV
jgi:A/G-specific adenine glycosylase